MAGTSYPNFDAYDLIWPEKDRGRPLAPVRVGVDRRSGKVMIGKPHVDQSIGLIFSTPFHTRILRQWVGSHVPRILGNNSILSTFMTFFFAIASAIDLQEPCARVMRIRVLSREDGTQLTSPEDIRGGHAKFVEDYLYMPRGHLGDKTPERVRSTAFVGNHDAWEIVDEDRPNSRDGRVGDYQRRGATQYDMLGWGVI